MNSLGIDYTEMDQDELAMWICDRRALNIERLSRLLTKVGHWHRLREVDDWVDHITVEYYERQYEIEVFLEDEDPEGWWRIGLREGEEYRSSVPGRTIGRMSIRELDNAPILAALIAALPPESQCIRMA